jgi:N-methylhydantoinase B
VLEMAGGGGFGDPAARDSERVAEDVRNELITSEVAYVDYKVALNDDGSVDKRATQSLRGVS